MIDLIAKSHYESGFDLNGVSVSDAINHIIEHPNIDFFIINGSYSITVEQLKYLDNMEK